MRIIIINGDGATCLLCKYWFGNAKCLVIFKGPLYIALASCTGSVVSYREKFGYWEVVKNE